MKSVLRFQPRKNRQRPAARHPIREAFNESNTIIVGNLPSLELFTRKDAFKLFHCFGTIKNLFFYKKECFVEFGSVASARQAHRRIHQTTYKGYELHVRFAENFTGAFPATEQNDPSRSEASEVNEVDPELPREEMILDEENRCPCVVVFHHKCPTFYPEYVSERIEKHLRLQKCRIRMIPANETVEDAVLRTAHEYFVRIVVLVDEKNIKFRSVTVNIFGESLEEHRNMPLGDAIGLIGSHIAPADLAYTDPHLLRPTDIDDGYPDNEKLPRDCWVDRKNYVDPDAGRMAHRTYSNDVVYESDSLLPDNAGRDRMHSNDQSFDRFKEDHMGQLIDSKRMRYSDKMACKGETSCDLSSTGWDYSSKVKRFKGNFLLRDAGPHVNEIRGDQMERRNMQSGSSSDDHAHRQVYYYPGQWDKEKDCLERPLDNRVSPVLNRYRSEWEDLPASGRSHQQKELSRTGNLKADRHTERPNSYRSSLVSPRIDRRDAAEQSEKSGFHAMFQRLSRGQNLDEPEAYDDLVDYLKAKREQLFGHKPSAGLRTSINDDPVPMVDPQQQCLQDKICTLFGLPQAQIGTGVPQNSVQSMDMLNAFTKKEPLPNDLAACCESLRPQVVQNSFSPAAAIAAAAAYFAAATAAASQGQRAHQVPGQGIGNPDNQQIQSQFSNDPATLSVRGFAQDLLSTSKTKRSFRGGRPSRGH